MLFFLRRRRNFFLSFYSRFLFTIKTKKSYKYKWPAAGFWFRQSDGVRPPRVLVARTGLHEQIVHRRELRRALAADGRDASILPDKWGNTRWECWYLCVVFIAVNITFLKWWCKELTFEAAAWKECADLLNDHGSLIAVEAQFIKCVFKSLYDALDKVFQLSPLPRGARVLAHGSRTPNQLLYIIFEE